MNAVEIRKKVQWKDLRHLTFKEKLIENSLTLPWLVGSLILAYHERYYWALPFSFFFVLTALRQVHNGFHKALGIGRRATEWCFYCNSVLMMVSVHAVKFCHLKHHAHCLGPEDYEGKSAGMSALGAIFYGPVHFFTIHWVTIRDGGRSYRLKVILELLAIGLAIGLVFGLEITFLKYHILIMLFGEFLMAFFAVWSVHHHTLDEPDLARTQRSYWKNKLTYGMFYHMEHHLFPAVPTIKMPELARRIDVTYPELKKQQTF